MKKHLSLVVAALAGLLLTSGASAVFFETNPVSSFNSTSGNPATDANGNQWTACQVDWDSRATASAWVPMTWDGSVYHGYFTNYQNAPNVSGTQYFVERSYDNGYCYDAGLIFKPDTAGGYSWQGTISWNNYDNANPLDIVFGKFTSAGVYTSLLTTTVPKFSPLNLSTQWQLQDIPLQAGDSLVLLGQISSYPNKGMFYLDSAFIGLPEPASLALLALGGLALFRRRR